MPTLRPCIFCGRHDGLSKEHIWPEWMAAYLPIAAPNAHVSEVHSGIPKQPSVLQRRSERPGPVHTKKVRAVCRRCNNGWMSELEARAKLPLLRILTSQDLKIVSEQSSTLATWAVLKAIVGEHASEDHLTPYEDRSRLRVELAIPPYFRVFAAKHTSTTKAAYLRHSATLSLSLKGPVPSLPKGINRNIQVTTILVGPLCLFITATRVHDIDVTLLDPVRSMLRIYPDPDESQDVEGSTALSDIDMHINSQVIERIMQHPKVKYGGERPSA